MIPHRPLLPRRVDRWWQMARHVPPRQLARRLVLRARRPLLRFTAPERPAPPLADTPPLPLFPPRPGLARLEEDRLRLFLPWGERVFPLPLRWLPDPRAGELARPDCNNLHYMEFLESLDDRAFVAFVEAWIRDNPPWAPRAADYAWRPYNLAVRVDVWMRELIRRRSAGTMTPTAAITASLSAQLHHLERNLETDLRGNHLIRDLLALLRASAFFAGPRAVHWRTLAEKWLMQELDAQVLADGCHEERSPPYHRVVLGDLLEACQLLPAGELRERLAERFPSMLVVARLLSHPDGGPALFNDGGSSMARSLEELETAAARLGIAPPLLPAGPFALPDAGYFGWYGEDERCIVDCGPLGPDHLVGHGHCDMLSFEWSTGGRRIVVDPGTAQYVPGPHRLACRGTAAHNTVSVPGVEQSDIFGAFRCGRRARAELSRWETAEDGFVFEGCHDGYAGLPDRPLHRRRIEGRPGEIRITDRLGTPPPHGAAAGLLLHPDCVVERHEGARLRLRNGPVRVEIHAGTEIRVEPAEWYPDLHRIVPTSRLRMPLPGDGTPLRTRLVRLPPDAGEA